MRFRQTYEGIPVYEGEYLVHVRSDGRIDMANGNYYVAIEAPTTPSVSERAARRVTRRDLGGSRLKLAKDTDDTDAEATDAEATDAEATDAEITSDLVIYPKNDGEAFLSSWRGG